MSRADRDGVDDEAISLKCIPLSSLSKPVQVGQIGYAPPSHRVLSTRHQPTNLYIIVQLRTRGHVNILPMADSRRVTL